VTAFGLWGISCPAARSLSEIAGHKNSAWSCHVFRAPPTASGNAVHQLNSRGNVID